MNTDNFKWDENLIKEFAEYWKNGLADYPKEYCEQAIQLFKSKQSKIIPKKEDGHVFDVDKLNHQLKILTSPILSMDDFTKLIKSACDGTYKDNIDGWNYAEEPIVTINKAFELVKQKLNCI